MSKRSSVVRAWTRRLLPLVILGGAVAVGEEAVQKVFKPPRVAVVDLQKIFELYDKKKDRKVEFEAQVKKVDESLRGMEARLKAIDEELPNLEPGPRKGELEFEKFRIERDGKSFKQSEANRLQELEMKFYQELRDEITEEIQTYSRALDLDLVLEKMISAEVGPRASVRWAVTHYAKPELEITGEIATRLNDRYKNVRPPTAIVPAAGGPTSNSAPTPATPKKSR